MFLFIAATAISVHELEPLSRTDDMILQQQVEGMYIFQLRNAEIFISDFLGNSRLCQVCCKYEIQPKMSKYLSRLSVFEIVIVCDDSSSMMSLVDGTQRTRWDELRSIVKIIVEIGVLFDSNGVDVYFLNRPAVLNVTDPTLIDQAFETPPHGFTPLVPVLDKVFRSELADHGRNKKLLVFVATDGEPTDRHGAPNRSELERVMKKVRNAETTYVSFVICTDDTVGVDYLDRWDKTMQNVDINDDYKTQRNKIRQCRGQINYPFTHGDYIVKALVGAVVPELDRLDEWD